MKAKHINKKHLSSEELSLNDKEESIIRLTMGMGVDVHAPLAKKTKNETLLKSLLELEQEIIEKAKYGNNIVRSK